MKRFIIGTLLAVSALAQTGKPVYGNEVHVVLVAVPTSPASAIPVSVEVKQIAITNTNASTQANVTISCTTSGLVFLKALVNGVSSQGNALVISYPFGLVCAGGVTWGSDVSGVTGAIRGGVQ